MSLGWSKKSTIYSNVAESVKTQLKTRKDLVNPNSNSTYIRSDSDLLFLNSNTGWVKLSSGVDVEVQNGDISNTASENILFGGTYNGSLKTGFAQNSKSSYAHSEQYGFKPMAGITRVNIKSEGTFGAIKKASVEFQVNSLDDLEKFEKLYLAPGYSMLLEWGHSLILENGTASVSSNVKTYSKWFKDLAPNDPEKGIHRSVAILNKFKEDRITQSNNYDALLGKVSNFNWSYNSDGAYDCSIDIIGYGELTESLSALFQPGVTKEERGLGIITPLYHYLDLILSLTPGPVVNEEGGSTVFDFKSSELTGDSKSQILQEFNNVLAGDIISANSDKPSGFSSYRYITLGSLLNFINNFYCLKDNNIPFVKFYCGKHDSIPSGKYENRNAFSTFSNHISYQPDVCVVPKPKNNNAKLKIDFASSKAVQNCIIGDTDDILNILINVSFIKNLYTQILENNKSKDINIYDMLRSLLDSVNSSLGDLNDFDFFEEDQKYYIVDRKIIPSGREIDFTLDLVGLKSLATSVSVSSNIPPNASTLIAIGASAGGTSLTEDVFKFENFNSGRRDRIVVQRTLDNVSDDKKLRTSENNAKLLNNIKTTIDYFSSINFKKVIPTTSLATIKPAHQVVMNLLFKNELVNKKTNPPGLLPIQLSFDILGISGFRITDVFNLGPGLLPSTYKDAVSFTITSIDNKIESNQWITSISALMMVTSEYTEIDKIDNNILEVISRIEEIRNIDQEDESLFPEATKFRNIIETTENFVEKGYELTSSGQDIKAATARGGIQLINQIKFFQERASYPDGTKVKDLKWRFTGGHDEFHIFNPNPGTTNHRIGKALDLAIQQDATIEQIKQASIIVFQAQLTVNNITNYLNEYEKPTGHATGGHWHFTFS